MGENNLGTTNGSGYFSRRSFLKGAAVAVAAMGTSSSLGPVSSVWADEAPVLTWPVPTGARNNTIGSKSVLKCYAPSTNCTLTEILGLSNPSFYKTEYTEYQDNLSASPTLGIWGSAANAQPNDYLSNLVYQSKGHNVDDRYVAVLGSALQNISQSAAWDDEDGVPLFMKHRPEILAVDDNTAWGGGHTETLADCVGVIRGFARGDGHYQDGDESYNPSFVNFRAYYGEKLGYMYSMWEVSDAAERLLAQDTTKTARYGAPSDQAARVEQFMLASQYAILRAISIGRTRRKVVAVVGGISDQENSIYYGVNVDTGRARIDAFSADSTDFSQITSWGSSTNFNVRYYNAAAALENCCDNIADVLGFVDGGDPTGNDPIIRDEAGVLWARPEALMQCDAIIVRTQTTVTAIPGTDELYQILREYGYTDQTKWPDIHVQAPVLGGYGASNASSLFWWYSYLLFVYPEIINPTYMSAYLIEEIYHVASGYTSDALEIICSQMSLPSGYELSVQGYRASDINKTFARGMEWYLDNKSAVDAAYPNLVMTSQMSAWLSGEKRKELGVRSGVKLPTLVSGASAAATMCAAIESAFTKANTIIVVGNTAGAAVAAPLSALHSAPVIVASTIVSNPAVVKELIAKLGVKKYVIVGNTAAVPAKVVTALKKMGLVEKRKRISGVSAAALSVNVAKSRAGWGTTAIVASTKDVQGLLAAMTFAYKKKAPIFLVGSKLTAAAKRRLKNKFKKVIVVGGTSVVSTKVVKTLPVKYVRVSGTGNKLAAAMVKRQLSSGLKASGAYYADASSKTVALVTAAAAAKKGVTFVPVANGKVSVTAAAVKAKKPTAAVVVGNASSATYSLYETVVDSMN